MNKLYSILIILYFSFSGWAQSNTTLKNDTVYTEEIKYVDSTVTVRYCNKQITAIYTDYNIKHKKGKRPKYFKNKFVEFENDSITRIIITTTYKRYGPRSSNWGQPIKAKKNIQLYQNGKWKITRGKWYNCAQLLN